MIQNNFASVRASKYDMIMTTTLKERILTAVGLVVSELQRASEESLTDDGFRVNLC